MGVSGVNCTRYPPACVLTGVVRWLAGRAEQHIRPSWRVGRAKSKPPESFCESRGGLRKDRSPVSRPYPGFTVLIIRSGAEKSRGVELFQVGGHAFPPDSDSFQDIFRVQRVFGGRAYLQDASGGEKEPHGIRVQTEGFGYMVYGYQCGKDHCLYVRFGCSRDVTGHLERGIASWSSASFLLRGDVLALHLVVHGSRGEFRLGMIRDFAMRVVSIPRSKLHLNYLRVGK